MTIQSRKRIKGMGRSPVRRVTRKSKLVADELSSVYLVRPKGTTAARERGQHLADQVRKELATLDNESLDETMMRLRGRSWSP